MICQCKLFSLRNPKRTSYHVSSRPCLCLPLSQTPPHTHTCFPQYWNYPGFQRCQLRCALTASGSRHTLLMRCNSFFIINFRSDHFLFYFRHSLPFYLTTVTNKQNIFFCFPLHPQVHLSRCQRNALACTHIFINLFLYISFSLRTSFSSFERTFSMRVLCKVLWDPRYGGFNLVPTVFGGDMFSPSYFGFFWLLRFPPTVKKLVSLIAHNECMSDLCSTGLVLPCPMLSGFCYRFLANPYGKSGWKMNELSIWTLTQQPSKWPCSSFLCFVDHCLFWGSM